MGAFAPIIVRQACCEVKAVRTSITSEFHALRKITAAVINANTLLIIGAAVLADTYRYAHTISLSLGKGAERQRNR